MVSALLALLLLLLNQNTMKSSPSINEDLLLARLRELYGLEAPNKITFLDSTSSDASFNTALKEPRDMIDVNARTGDLGSGVIVEEKDGLLYLDARPCTGAFLVFNKPYTKTKIGQVTCGGKSTDRYLIEKKSK